jgi:hypothetical protein
MGRAIALILALTAAAGPMASRARTQGGDDAPRKSPTESKSVDDTQQPAARKPVAGLNGFESVSTLVYDAAPQAPHRLTATYVFPDRARWMLAKQDEKGLQRQLRYRYGERTFAIEPRASTSREHDESERLATLRQMELRRAMMLWPDGFDWKLSGDVARAEMGALGALVAHVVETPGSPASSEGLRRARPDEMSCRDGAGSEQDSYRALTWQESRGRQWPSTAELWHAGKLVWRERFESIDIEAKFIDSYFLPPDRRAPGPRASSPAPAVQHLDLPAVSEMRAELASGTTWVSAVDEFKRLHAAWVKTLQPLGLELERFVNIELRGDRTPAACLLRLTKPSHDAPPEFRAVEACSGLARRISALGELTSDLVRSLEQASPKGSTRDTAYVRVEIDSTTSGPFIVVLRLSTAH